MAVEKNTLYCSFCGKSQHEVKKLIAGPVVFICDECVTLCMNIIVEADLPNDEPLSREAELFRREALLSEAVSLMESMLEQERIRRRPYDLLEEKLNQIKSPMVVKTDVFSG